jgi:predicted nucleotidyltransferase
MTKTELLTTLLNVKDELEEQFGIVKIALFGSYARDEANNDSDVDIAIMQIEKKDYFTRVEAKYYLEKLLGKRVDIGYFDSMRPIIQKYIKKEMIFV